MCDDFTGLSSCFHDCYTVLRKAGTRNTDLKLAMAAFLRERT